MSTEQRLPPSGRDFDVFSAVIVGGQTTRQAAAQFKVSQTRICQIARRVQAWQAEVVPADGGLPEERRLCLAKQVAAARLDHLYGEMMAAWRSSQGETKKIRSARYGDEVTTTTISCGDPKYLLAAMRLAKAQSELGAWGGLSYFAPVEEEETESGRTEARPAADHPARDCSQKPVREPAPAPATTEAEAPTAKPVNSSCDLSPEQRAARRQLFEPVQTAAAPGDRSVTQIEVTPESLGLSVADILSRQDRRSHKRARRAG